MNNISINQVSKIFDDTKAVNNISLNIKKNKIYGLIGRNGAGKTTLLKLIANHITPTTGTINIDNTPILNNDMLMQKICYAREIIKVKNMINTKVKNIFYLASLIYPNWDNDYFKDLISKFDLDINKKYNKLSKGMQTMVGIIIGLASKAPITLFDEPYVGLDPVARELFYESLIEEYEANPRTIIISTHLINELENLFEEIIIIHKGKLLLNQKSEDIKNKARVVSGEKNIVNSILKNKNVVYTQSIGRLVDCTVLDDFTQDEINTMKENQIDFNSLSLQKLFVNLSKGGNVNDIK